MKPENGTELGGGGSPPKQINLIQKKGRWVMLHDRLWTLRTILCTIQQTVFLKK